MEFLGGLSSYIPHHNTCWTETSLTLQTQGLSGREGEMVAVLIAQFLRFHLFICLATDFMRSATSSRSVPEGFCLQESSGGPIGAERREKEEEQ